MTLRIGTRGSDLALWQAHFVESKLAQKPEIIIIKTEGDRIQNLTLDKVEGKGFFTKEIEAALHEKRVDIAVHSFKDLPTDEPPGLRVAAVPPRAPVRDVIVRRQADTDSEQLWGLRPGARVGTSSLRRKAHVLSRRPDLELVDLRGNVPTRFNKVTSQELDAVILAEAGLTRLGLDAQAKEGGLILTPIEVDDVCPAPAQGALAIQIRSDHPEAAEAVALLHDPATAMAVNTERSLLARFGGGCHLPLGAYCISEGVTLHLRALVVSPDGTHRIEAQAQGEDPNALVNQVHAELSRQGAEKYL